MSQMPITRILLVGAGAIGRLHAGEITKCTFCTLSGIVDPTLQGREWAETLNIPWFATLEDALIYGPPDAAIVATPNHTHRALALKLIDAGVVTLVEKPIASSLEDAGDIVRASEESGVSVLIGHHRRHNPIIREAKSIIEGGTLGRLTSVTIMALFNKPDEYFSIPWRREAGGGPILINLIHEIDLVRYLYGEIRTVQAIASNARRGFDVEDTASVLMRLENDVLVTVSLSDCVSAPWSWDLQSGEISSYPTPPTSVTTTMVAGSNGSLSLPSLDIWSYQGKRDWYEPLTRSTTGYFKESPYIAQLRNLCDVAQGRALPVVPAKEGLLTLRATLAAAEAAKHNTIIDLSNTRYD